MKRLFGVMVVVGVLLAGPHLLVFRDADRALREQIDASVGHLSAARHVADNRSGYLQVEGVSRPLTEDFIHAYISRSGKSDKSVWVWRWGGVGKATVSAMGIDRRHHFPNSYLLGYQPFKTDHLWVPLYTLAMRKRYQYDHLQYSGLKDVWQNSKQAYYFTRGDCEDHAIILADWLIEMGVDARVVLGRHKTEGHAWVVYAKAGKTFLLEATDKRKNRGMGAIPEASVMVQYQPEFQFNREHFWVNTGSSLTTQYTGRHWKRTSRFVPSNSAS